MATIVTGDLYRDLDGKFLEIKRQLRQSGGYPYNPVQLKFALQDVIEGKFGVGGPFPSSAIAAKYGYEVVADVEPSAFEMKDLEFIPFLEKGEKPVTGKVMRGHAVILEANFGLVDGKYISDHQDEILAGLRGKIIVLSGTLLRSPGGDLCVACLCWGDDRGFLLFLMLEGDWRDDYRLACRK